MEQEQKNTAKINRYKGLKPRWKKGDKSPNPNGHPKGQRNFITIYREALKKLAKDNGTSESVLENEIVAKGIVQSRKGHFSFYKDTMDRVHGQAIKPIEHSGSVDNKATENFTDEEIQLARKLINERRASQTTSE